MKPSKIEFFTHVTRLRGAVVGMSREMAIMGDIEVFCGDKKIADATSFSMEIPITDPKTGATEFRWKEPK
jgi:hypothetical protein